MEKQSIFLPACERCAVKLQRWFRVRGGKDVWITSTAGKEFQKAGKKNVVNFAFKLSFLYF